MIGYLLLVKTVLLKKEEFFNDINLRFDKIDLRSFKELIREDNMYVQSQIRNRLLLTRLDHSEH